MTDKQSNGVRSAEILFVKCVKDGIPNRDPLRDSDARRLFGEEDGRISLSDVSLKRDVRDFILARFPDGGEDHRMGVFVRKEFSEGNKLLGRGKLAESLLERAGEKGDGDVQAALNRAAFDVRVFGAVFSVKGKSFNQCGPTQFGWAHSLHPAETRYVQGTVVMPSKDVEVKEDTGEETGATQGTIWTAYTLPFAVFAMPAVVNASIAKDTGMTGSDVDMLLEGLWKGTIHRQARGRGVQQPLLLVHVEYTDPFSRIGFLEEHIKVEPEREAWLSDRAPTTLAEVTLDVSALADMLNARKGIIARTRVWTNAQLNLKGELPCETSQWD